MANVETSKIHRSKGYFESATQKKKPLNKFCEDRRLDFARDYMAWSSVTTNESGEWRKVIFGDENKFNLDGPAGYNYYFHDLIEEERYLSRHNSCEGGVLLWGAISYYGAFELKIVDYKMTGNSFFFLVHSTWEHRDSTDTVLRWFR